MAARKKAVQETAEQDPEKNETAKQETAKQETAKQEKKETTLKAKVVIPYIDKNTDKLHNAGSVVEVTEKRFKEINKNMAHLKKA